MEVDESLVQPLAIYPHTTVFSISQPELQHAVVNQRGFSINTGNVTITTSSALLYFKNDEDNPFIIDKLIVGIGSGSSSDIGEITLVRNPTAGSLIDSASAVSISQNMNFTGSSAFKGTTLTYKGEDTSTLTDGNDIQILYQDLASNVVYSDVNFRLPKGTAVGVKVNPYLSAGNVKCNVSIQGFVVDWARTFNNY